MDALVPPYDVCQNNFVFEPGEGVAAKLLAIIRLTTLFMVPSRWSSNVEQVMGPRSNACT